MSESTLVDLYEDLWDSVVDLDDNATMPASVLVPSFCTTVGIFREFYTSPRAFYIKHPEVADNHIY